LTLCLHIQVLNELQAYASITPLALVGGPFERSAWERKKLELREVLRGLLEPTRNEPGCRRYDMNASDQRGRFFAIETWESRRALDKHKQTPHFKAAAASFSELLQGTLALDILDAIVQ
jgi:quinol monooxygenase YgiN